MGKENYCFRHLKATERIGIQYLFHLPHMSTGDQEFINIGLSHTANHLLTQFYNIEESILHQQRNLKNCRDFHNLNLDVKIDTIRKLAYYTPRSILYDTKNSGNYASNWGNNANNEARLKQYQKIETFNDSVEKSGFQKDLDAGKMPKSVTEIDEEGTGECHEVFYWTDYNKFLLKPENMIISQEWYHHPTRIPVNLPTYKENKDKEMYLKHFLHPDSGRREYSSRRYDLWDDKLHHWLERCDNFRHFNLVSEFDTAWGYMNNELLQDIRDEFPKLTVFQYSLTLTNTDNVEMSQNSKTAMFINNIINTAECLENVSLLFPLSYQPQDSLSFDYTSQQALVFQAISSIFDKTDDRLTPSELVRRLTFNNNSSISQQKILTNITVNENKEFNHIQNFKIPTNFHHDKFKTWKLDNGDPSTTHLFGSVHIQRTNNSESMDAINTYKLDKNYLNTFFTPGSFVEIKDLSLAITNSKRFTKVLKYWLNYTVKNQSYIKNVLSADSDYVDEIIELLHSLVKSYSLGKSYLDVDGYEMDEENSSFDGDL